MKYVLIWVISFNSSGFTTGYSSGSAEFDDLAACTFASEEFKKPWRESQRPWTICLPKSKTQ